MSDSSTFDHDSKAVKPPRDIKLALRILAPIPAVLLLLLALAVLGFLIWEAIADRQIRIVWAAVFSVSAVVSNRLFRFAGGYYRHYR